MLLTAFVVSVTIRGAMNTINVVQASRSLLRLDPVFTLEMSQVQTVVVRMRNWQACCDCQHLKYRDLTDQLRMTF